MANTILQDTIGSGGGASSGKSYVISRPISGAVSSEFLGDPTASAENMVNNLTDMIENQIANELQGITSALESGVAAIKPFTSAAAGGLMALASIIKAVPTSLTIVPEMNASGLLTGVGNNIMQIIKAKYSEIKSQLDQMKTLASNLSAPSIDSVIDTIADIAINKIVDYIDENILLYTGYTRQQIVFMCKDGYKMAKEYYAQFQETKENAKGKFKELKEEAKKKKEEAKAKFEEAKSQVKEAAKKAKEQAKESLDKAKQEYENASKEIKEQAEAKYKEAQEIFKKAEKAGSDIVDISFEEYEKKKSKAKLEEWLKKQGDAIYNAFMFNEIINQVKILVEDVKSLKTQMSVERLDSTLNKINVFLDFLDQQGIMMAVPIDNPFDLNKFGVDLQKLKDIKQNATSFVQSQISGFANQVTGNLGASFGPLTSQNLIQTGISTAIHLSAAQNNTKKFSLDIDDEASGKLIFSMCDNPGTNSNKAAIYTLLKSYNLFDTANIYNIIADAANFYTGEFAGPGVYSQKGELTAWTITYKKVSPESMNLDLGSITSGISGVTDKIGGITGGITDKLGGVTDKLGNVTDKLGNITDKVGNVTDKINGVTDKISGITDTIGNATNSLNNIASNVTGNVTNIANNITNSITDAVDSASGIMGSFTSIASGAITDIGNTFSLDNLDISNVTEAVSRKICAPLLNVLAILLQLLSVLDVVRILIYNYQTNKKMVHENAIKNLLDHAKHLKDYVDKKKADQSQDSNKLDSSNSKDFIEDKIEENSNVWTIRSIDGYSHISKAIDRYLDIEDLLSEQETNKYIDYSETNGLSKPGIKRDKKTKIYIDIRENLKDGSFAGMGIEPMPELGIVLKNNTEFDENPSQILRALNINANPGI